MSDDAPRDESPAIQDMMNDPEFKASVLETMYVAIRYRLMFWLMCCYRSRKRKGKGRDTSPSDSNASRVVTTSVIRSMMFSNPHLTLQ